MLLDQTEAAYLEYQPFIYIPRRWKVPKSAARQENGPLFSPKRKQKIQYTKMLKFLINCVCIQTEDEKTEYPLKYLPVPDKKTKQMLISPH